jgi:hypothetical protein
MKGMVNSMEKTLEKLTSADGVIAASLVTPSVCETRLAAKHLESKVPWDEFFASLAASLDHLNAHGCKDLRVIAGEYTINLERFDGAVLCVATSLGHPVAKSLRRMMARAMKQTAPSTREGVAFASPSQPAI